METRVQGNRRTMRTAIDTDQLIKEIEQRPTLWNKKLVEYNDRDAKRKCWEELTEVFSPGKISQKERQELNFQLQNRWKNIKDRFSRTNKPGSNKRSGYVYGSMLQFLINQKGKQKYPKSVTNGVPTARRAPSTKAKVLKVSKKKSKPPPEKRTGTVNTPMSKNTPSPSDMPEKESKSSPQKRTRTDNNLVSPASKNTPSTSSEIIYMPEEESKPPPEKRTKTFNSLIETKLIEFLERNMTELQDVTKNSQDEDRLFLLSLLTSLKTIQPHFQLKAKIEILSVLDKYPKTYEESDIVPQPQILEVRHSVDIQ